MRRPGRGTCGGALVFAARDFEYRAGHVTLCVEQDININFRDNLRNTDEKYNSID